MVCTKGECLYPTGRPNYPTTSWGVQRGRRGIEYDSATSKAKEIDLFGFGYPTVANQHGHDMVKPAVD